MLWNAMLFYEKTHLTLTKRFLTRSSILSMNKASFRHSFQSGFHVRNAHESVLATVCADSSQNTYGIVVF